MIRQPLFHFFLFGAALFALFELVNDDPVESPRTVIVVSPQEAQWLAKQYETTWRRPPSADELDSMLDDYVREEIYVREALSLGLDQGDTVVRRRLRQKMEFLTESGAEAVAVEDDVLMAYFQENIAEYTGDVRIAFSQIALPQPSQPATADILAQLADGADFSQLGVRSLLPPQTSLMSASGVDSTFGNGVFAQISELEPNQWLGPVKSGFGDHLVRLDVYEAGQVPDFADIRDRVEQDWRLKKAADLRVERFLRLKDLYEVELPDTALVLQK